MAIASQAKAMICRIIQIKREEFLRKDISLRKPSRLVEKFGEELRGQLKDLTDTFESHEIAVGLAAPQIGIQFRMCLVNIQKGKPHPHLILINPTIINYNAASEERFESCMSLPLFRGKVSRYSEIEVSFQDEHGSSKTINADGFLARVIQHEVDHLNGILYVDRMRGLETLEPAEKPKFIE